MVLLYSFLKFPKFFYVVFQGKTLIVSGLAESKKEHGVELLNKLEAGINELELIV